MKSRAWTEGFETARKNRSNWERECARYRQEVELQQRPLIRRRKIEGGQAQDAVRKIDEFLNKIKAKPEFVLDQAKARAKISLVLLPLLSLASYGLLFLTFQPFDIGWKAHVASAGIVIATALMMELFLNSFFSKKWLIFSFASVALFCLIFAHVQLGLIRAELFKTLADAQAQGSAGRFYQRSAGLLVMALPMLALGIELATGLTLHSIIEWLFSPEIRAHRRKASELRRMIACDEEIQFRTGLPEIEEAEFRAGASAGLMKKKMFSAEKRLAAVIPIVLILILLLSLFASRAFGEESNGVVIILDLTKSVSPDECSKNAKAVEACLNETGPGEKITVLAITDRSFGNPVILLRGRTGEKPGYFKEKLKEERHSLISEWQEKAKALRPAFLNSDVIGAIAIGQIFLEEGSGQEKRLLIFSDMRHVTEELDLESPREINPSEFLARAEKLGAMPSLKNVDVYALGVLTDDKSPSYWLALREFWKGFFAKAGASLKKYSVTREVN